MQYALKNHTVRSITHHIAHMEPRTFKRKTGQIVKLLAENAHGLSRQDMLHFFCQNFQSASYTRRESLRMCLEKIIQRSRQKFYTFNLTIVYDKKRKKYFLDVVQKNQT